LSVFVNGSEFARLDRLRPSVDFINTHYLDQVMLKGSTTARLIAGDTVDIRIWFDTAANVARNTEALAASNWFCVEQIFGPKWAA